MSIVMKNSDILDRWSILRMKARINTPAFNEFKAYNVEAAFLINQLADGPQGLEPIFKLIEANAKIWALEAAIREGNSLPLEDVGRRAIDIRQWNKLRIEAKSDIDSFYSQPTESKVDHASQ